MFISVDIDTFIILLFIFMLQIMLEPDRFPQELMYSYASIRNSKIGRDMLLQTHALMKAKKPGVKVPTIPFDLELSETPIAFEEYLLYVN